MSKKTTKRALALSFVSVFLCVCMLVGTTFAWFTDSVTSSNNIIKSGTLDVTMEWAEGTADPATVSWTDASTGAIFNYDKWEPGYVEVRHIKIANVGTLALKYQLNIVANDEVSELADVIDVYYVDSAVQVTDRAQLTDANKIGTLDQVLANFTTTASGNLLAGENHTVTIALKMQETADNQYQNKSIGTDFSVVLVATQLTAEEDSFGNDYDENAVYADVFVADQESLTAAIAAAAPGEVIALTAGTYTFPTGDFPEDVVLNCEPGTVFEGTSKLDVNGATVVGATFSNDTGNVAASSIEGTFKDCTFDGYNVLSNGTTNGDVTFEGCTIEGDKYGIHFDSGAGENNIVFKNCKITGYTTFAASIESVVFEDCEFINEATDPSGATQVNIWGGEATFKNCHFDEFFWMIFVRGDAVINIDNVTYDGNINDFFYQETSANVTWNFVGTEYTVVKY